jgi:RNA polymerase subunit RPABC4/transcription elongation factor Spt4
MEESETPSASAEQECPNCGRSMSSRARLCPTCHSYRQQWKNWLSFYGSAAGVIAIIVSAATFIGSDGPRVYASLFGRDAIRSLYFEYPGPAAFMNTGAHDVVIESISLDWKIADVRANPIELPVDKLIKPGEVLFISLPSQYPEPAGINGAPWVRENSLSVPLVRNAFEIGTPQRCAVFHVYNANHAVFRLIDEMGLRPLATEPARAVLNVFHTDSGTLTSGSMGTVLTAFVAIKGCVPEAGGTLTK